MDRDNRTGIRTETSVNGIQAAKPLPPWESTSRLQLGGAPQRGAILRWFGCLLAVLLVLLPLLAIAGFLWWMDGAPVRRAEKMVADGGPGIGATRGEVEAWLDRQGIGHSRIGSLKTTGGYPAEQPPSKFGCLVSGIQDEHVVGMVHPSQLQSSAGGEVWIYFFFDSDGRLIQHVIKKWDGWL
jgi:hypothetical protein